MTIKTAETVRHQYGFRDQNGNIELMTCELLQTIVYEESDGARLVVAVYEKSIDGGDVGKAKRHLSRHLKKTHGLPLNFTKTVYGGDIRR